MPGAPGSLNLSRIIEAAIAIADEAGLEALSMRRVADRLGNSVMSLYRHVDDKDRLVALAIDAVFGEEPFPPSPPSGWRAHLNESAWRQWRIYQRHPWVSSVVSLDRPVIGPNGLRETEWAFSGLQSLAISDSERLRIYLAVTAFVHGCAVQATAEATVERQSGVSRSTWWSSQSGALRELFATGRYPHIARLGAVQTPSPESLFAFGLASLLDGIEASLA